MPRYWRALWTVPPILFTVVLLALPSFWLGSRYSLGGDDSRMYAIYPQQWLAQVALPAFGNASVSGFATFSTEQGYLFLTALFVVFRALFPCANLQAVSYGMALASGFLGIYCTVLLITKDRDDAIRRVAALIAGFSYATCPLAAVYYWANPFAWVMGIGGVPLLTAVAIAYLLSGRVWWMVLFSLGAAFFAIGLQAVPITLGYGLAFLLAMAGWLAWQGHDHSCRLRYARRGLVVAAAAVCASAFWLIPLVLSIRIPGSFGSGALVGGGPTAAGVVRDVARGQSVLETLVLLPPPQFLRIFDWPQLSIWDSWYVFLIIPSLMLFATILASLFVAFGRIRWFHTVVVLLSIVVFFAYLQTVNITSHGVDLFATFVTRVPGTKMFRDFFNKFTGGYMFAYAVLLATSLIIIVRLVRFPRRWLLGVAVALVVALQGIPMVLGAPLLLPIGGSSVADVGTFSPSFLQSMRYLANAPGFGRVLELPLSTQLLGSVIPLADPGSVYRGISPVRVLSGKETMNSYASFTTAGSLELDRHLSDAIRDDNIDALRDILRLSGVQFILFSSGYPGGAIRWLQQPIFPKDPSAMRVLADRLGAMQVAHFPAATTSTDVYALSGASMLPLVFAEDDNQIRDDAGVAGEVRSWLPVGTRAALRPDATAVQSVRRISSWEYRVQLDLRRPSTLVLLEPYDAGWVAKLPGGSSSARPLVKTRVDGYASAWAIPGTGPVTVSLTYQPQQVVWAGLGVTIGFALLAVAWALTQSVLQSRRGAACRGMGKLPDDPA